jgi:hypothetical protein
MDNSKMYSLKSATIRDINTDLVFPCYCCQNNKNGDLRENSPTCWTNCEYDRGPKGRSNFKPFFTLDGCAWTDFDGQPPVMSDEEIRNIRSAIARGDVKPECEGWTNINGHCRPNKIFIRFLSTPFWYFDRKSETDDEYILNPTLSSEYIPSSSPEETTE